MLRLHQQVSFLTLAGPVRQTTEADRPQLTQSVVIKGQAVIERMLSPWQDSFGLSLGGDQALQTEPKSTVPCGLVSNCLVNPTPGRSVHPVRGAIV